MLLSRNLTIRLSIAAVLFLCALPGWTQNGQTNTNSSQAVLHLQVNVMPTVFTAPSAGEVSEKAAVSYSVPTLVVQQEIKTEVQILRELQPNQPCSAQPCSGTLLTTTLVAR